MIATRPAAELDGEVQTATTSQRLTDALDHETLAELRGRLPLLAAIVGAERRLDNTLLHDLQILHASLMGGRPYHTLTPDLFGGRQKPPTKCNAELLVAMLAETRRITRLNVRELLADNQFALSLIRLQAERLHYCLRIHLPDADPPRVVAA